MSFSAIVTAAKGGIKVAGFFLKRHSHQIAFGASVISGAAALYATAKGTAVALDKIKEHEDNIETINNTPDGPIETEHNGTVEYNATQREADLKIERNHKVIDVVKAYLPAAALAAVSLACGLAGFKILSGRLAVTTAALNASVASFKKYRSRVAEAIGTEAENAIYRNMKPVAIDGTKTVDENGNETEVVKMVPDSDNPTHSIYAQVLDFKSALFNETNHDITMRQIRATEKFFTEKLRVEKHLLLNHVYEQLDLPLTDYGMIAGWVWDDENPTGDNCVDLGISKEDEIDFINGATDTLIIDPNCQGSIFGMMSTHQIK